MRRKQQRSLARHALWTIGKFMSSTAHAVFTTLGYCQLGFKRVARKVGRLIRPTRQNPLVSELVRTYALVAYRERRANRRDEQQLEAFLVATYPTGPAPRGAVAIPARGATRSSLVAQLRKLRDETPKDGYLER
jgi:hypothetical protein